MALCYLLLFMQNLFLLHQQLLIVLVARIRLLWSLEVLIQLRIRRHRRRFHPHWIFPRSAESWFEIYLQLSSAIFLRSCSVEICEWVEIHSAIYCYVPREKTGGKSCGHVRFVIHMLQTVIYQRTQHLQQLIFNAHCSDVYYNSLCVVKTEINTNRTSISKAKIAETKPVKETNLHLSCDAGFKRLRCIRCTKILRLLLNFGPRCEH